MTIKPPVTDTLRKCFVDGTSITERALKPYTAIAKAFSHINYTPLAEIVNTEVNHRPAFQ